MRLLFITCLVSIALFVPGCSSEITKGVDIDRGFRPLIPRETQALIGINVENLTAAPLYKRHQDSLAPGQFSESFERFGVNPQRDIARILFAWNAKTSVVMLRGRFTQESIEQKLSNAGVPKSAHGKRVFFGDSRYSMTFFGKDLAVAGSAQALEAVAATEERNEGGVPDEISRLLQNLNPRDQVWAVSRNGLPMPQVPIQPNYESALSNIVGYIKQASLGVAFDTGAHLEGNFGCISPEGAQRVGDALRGAVAMGRLTTKDNERDLLRIYDSIHVQQQEQTVLVNAALSSELADRLFAYLPKPRR